ncbi:MAG: hypothetical protein ACR2IF_15485 [Terriglobales bacterium]
MARNTKMNSPRSRFGSVAEGDVPHSRNGKHKSIITAILEDLDGLPAQRALKIALAELPDTKANIRSALNRASRTRGLEVATSSDDVHLYIWKKNGHVA